MPPKDSTPIDPGAVYFQAPEGLQPLLPLDEAPGIEAEEWAEKPEWPKENPYIKTAPEEITFIAEVKINPEVAKAFTALGEACKTAAEALGRAVRAAADCTVAIARGVDITKMQEALKEAPPRVRHLAQHGKKYRTRKKNINRILREYQRRSRKRDRP